MEEIAKEKVSGKLIDIIAELLNTSKSKSRILLKQGAIDTTRNGETWKSELDDWALKGDVLRIGKGRFFKLN